MIDPLTPSQVHQLSSIVYKADQAFQIAQANLRGSGAPVVTRLAGERFKPLLENQPNLNLKQFALLSGYSGIFQIKQLSGFGFIAEGCGGREGELILVTRGTNFPDNPFDIATNANAGIAVGPRGKVVHRGFQKTFESYKHQLLQFIISGRRTSHIKAIHCMGHSLGGALANLNAATLRSAGYTVKLYTIGAPRVGLFPFAQDVTKVIKPQNIYRVSNPCDPVPMVPVFPFMHASEAVSEYLLSTNDKIAVEQHYLTGGYGRMAHLQAWSDLTPAPVLRNITAKDIANGLIVIGGGLMFSGTALQIVKRDVVELLKLMGIFVVSMASVAWGVGVTAVDLLAEALLKAQEFGKEVGEQIRSVLTLLLGFLGRGTIQVQEGSLSFIRWVLDTFVREMNSQANRAVKLARQQ